ncbi:ABC transporter ATP-binding protein [Agromyces sp. NPDC057679]|uniref:ATP-binding cassette domain-containing protein n=1 Tax=Agromyces sp. NPDC057679 TaxID=3346207 RepID=UPI003671782E
METTTLDGKLRDWARGMTTTAAATELLIRAGYAGEHREWVHTEDPERPWIDFASIPDLIGGLSGGQQRVLRIASSLASDVPIRLGDEITGLDYPLASLVLAACAQASGYGDDVRFPELVGDDVKVVTKPAILRWPA